MEANWVPIVTLILLLLVHVAARVLSLKKNKKKSKKLHPAEQQLLSEIKDLVGQANSLSAPSTFAKAAKLKRSAAAKEKELAQLRKSLAKEQRWPISLQMILPTALKAFAYLLVGYWLWGCPVFFIPSQLIQPLDKVFAWTTDAINGSYMKIGIIPWLVVCSRVVTFISNKIIHVKVSTI